MLDARTLKVQRFLRTGMGTHSIYPDRTATRLFVANRDGGTVTVLDASTLRTLHTWRLPGGGSPDMGGVSADGRTLWLSGRYNSVVYVLDTSDRQAAEADPRRQRTARTVRVAPAGALQPRPHRQHALTRRSSLTVGAHREAGARRPDGAQCRCSWPVLGSSISVPAFR